jgi:hypothetical protein
MVPRYCFRLDSDWLGSLLPTLILTGEGEHVGESAALKSRESVEGLSQTFRPPAAFLLIRRKTTPEHYASDDRDEK